MFIRSGYSAHTRSSRAISGTEHHHAAGDVLVGGRQDARRLLPQARLGALAAEHRDGHEVELDQVALRLPGGVPGALERPGRSRLVLAEDPPLAFDHDAPARLGHAERAAEVERAVDARALGSRPDPAARAIERLELAEDRAGERRAGAQMRARPPQEADTCAAPTEQLDRLHRHDAEGVVVAGERE